MQYFKYNPKLYVFRVQCHNTGCSKIVKHDIKEDRLGCRLAEWRRHCTLSPESGSDVVPLAALVAIATARFCSELLFWTAYASKLTFPLALQSDPRCAHLCVCHDLPHGFLPSPCLWAQLSAHDKKMHGNRHQAIWHVFVFRKCRVRNSVSRLLIKGKLPLRPEEQLKVTPGNRYSFKLLFKKYKLMVFGFMQTRPPVFYFFF